MTTERPTRRPAATRSITRTVELDLPDWVRHLRVKAALGSNDELVDRAREALPPSLRQGLNRRWLAQVLAGELEFDEVPVIRWLALARALGVSVEELIGISPGDSSTTTAELDALAALLRDTWT